MSYVLTATSGRDYSDFEPGPYNVIVDAVEHVDSQYSEEGQFQWSFRITEEGYDDITVRAWSNLAFGPEAKTRKWAEILLKRKVEGGEQIDITGLVGYEAIANLDLRETERGTFPKLVSLTRKRVGQRGQTMEAAREEIGKQREAERQSALNANDIDTDDLPF